MDKMLELAIVIGVIILLLVIVIYEFLKIRKTIKIANRIDKFTLKVPGKNEPTIGDDLNRNVNSLISKISNILSKSTYFTKKANKYDRYSAIKKNPNYKYDVYSSKVENTGFGLVGDILSNNGIAATVKSKTSAGVQLGQSR